MVRGKFTLRSITQNAYMPLGRELKFMAVYDTDTEENRRYAKATPSGEITMTVDNPSALEELAAQIGQSFYVDFTPIPMDPAK